ncbi:hypothetical protein BH11ACT4_BH11ACT4_23560 [soil metagenome]
MTTDTHAQDSSEGGTLLRGRYRLGELLGTGGLAGVYRAYDEFLGRDVAVKIFRANASLESDFHRQEDEVNVLARLNHPNLVTLLDAAVDRTDPDDPRVYYVMELVEGTDLQHRLAEGTLTPRQIAQLGYYVASGLEQVHHLGIVHRDIKPSNIMLANYLDDGSQVTAKLTDFGIASVGSADPISADEIVTGTVAYLSPEQASGELVTTASDIYSLGLVLLQCFTRDMPFPGPPQHAALARLIDDPPIRDSVPEEWVPLLTGMTERDPADRPSTHEVAMSLREMFTSEMGRHRLDPTPSPPDAAAAAPTEAFDHITALAATVLGAPVAVLAVEGRTWHTSRRSGPIDDPAALLDAAAAQDAGYAFSVSVALRGDEGQELGTLCVLDEEQREATLADLATLSDLAAIVVRELLSVRELQSAGVPEPA